MVRRLVMHLAVAACASGPRPVLGNPASEPGSGLPAIPEMHGPLKLTMVYPDSLARIAVRDSSFVFGSVGDGAAELRINGAAVRVAPNGGWIAWIPLPGDSIVTLLLEARTATDSARLEYRVRRVPRFAPPPAPLWIDSTSFTPVGRVWWPGTRYLELSLNERTS